jgi:hypothetical protein
MGQPVEWVFPVDDDDDPELAYAMGHRTRDFNQRHKEVPRGPMRYVIGDDGFLVIMEGHLPLLRAFLKALDAAPEGTEFITCVRCGCRAVWVGAELRGTENTGAQCDEHDCRHTSWNTRRDARCRFCGEGLRAIEDRPGVIDWIRSYDDSVSRCPHSPETPATHKPIS